MIEAEDHVVAAKRQRHVRGEGGFVKAVAGSAVVGRSAGVGTAAAASDIAGGLVLIPHGGNNGIDTDAARVDAGIRVACAPIQRKQVARLQ